MQSPDISQIQYAIPRQCNVGVVAQTQPDLGDPQPKLQTDVFRPAEMSSPESIQSASYDNHYQLPPEKNSTSNDVFTPSLISSENIVDGAAQGEKIEISVEN